MGTSIKSVNEKIQKALSYKDKLGEIQKYLQEASELESTKKDEFGYMIPALQKLMEMMEECEQYDLDMPEGSDPIFTTRVFKCNRYIPDYMLNMFHVKQAKLGGLFVELPCWLLPADKVDAASDNRFKAVMKPEEFGLPSTDQANYATIKQLTPNCYIVLAKLKGFDICGDWIYTSRQVEYVYAK